ncbi:hypothetical protein MP228_005992 [Amoeboaphelidium protococcarum]|nr:hypothetical protein MP228_005992 [Amoeboaphelidium protococcarum]
MIKQVGIIQQSLGPYYESVRAVDTATKVLDAVKMQFAPPSLATQVRLDELLDQLSYDSKADPLHLFNYKICVTYL